MVLYCSLGVQNPDTGRPIIAKISFHSSWQWSFSLSVPIFNLAELLACRQACVVAQARIGAQSAFGVASSATEIERQSRQTMHMGYWPSVRSGWPDIGQVLFLACLRTETKSRSITRKKRTRPLSSHLDRTNLVNKGFIIWLSRKFFLRYTAVSPEQARWLHLARSGSQPQCTIWVILPARGSSHKIKWLYFSLLAASSPDSFPLDGFALRRSRALLKGEATPRLLSVFKYLSCTAGNYKRLVFFMF